MCALEAGSPFGIAAALLLLVLVAATLAVIAMTAARASRPPVPAAWTPIATGGAFRTKVA
jgi:hypothetical protein